MLYRKQVTFTASQSWTFPTTALPAAHVISRGAGGGGGGAAAAGAKGGGGGGGERKEQDTNFVPGTTYSMLIGSPGPGGYATAWDGTQFAVVAPGGDGGDTSILGTDVLARGGKGGGTPTSTNGSGNGGKSGAGADGNTSTTIVSTSTPGSYGTNNAGDAPPALYGECSGGSGASPQQRSLYPGAGKGANSVGNGSDATEIGCGGGGAWSTSGSAGARTGGTGYRGQIDIIYWDTAP